MHTNIASTVVCFKNVLLSFNPLSQIYSFQMNSLSSLKCYLKEHSSLAQQCFYPSRGTGSASKSDYSLEQLLILPSAELLCRLFQLCSFLSFVISFVSVSATAYVTRGWCVSLGIQIPSLSWRSPLYSSTRTCTAPTSSQRGRWSWKTLLKTFVVS